MAIELFQIISVQSTRQWHDIVTLDESWIYLFSDHDLMWTDFRLLNLFGDSSSLGDCFVKRLATLSIHENAFEKRMFTGLVTPLHNTWQFRKDSCEDIIIRMIGPGALGSVTVTTMIVKIPLQENPWENNLNCGSKVCQGAHLESHQNIFNRRTAKLSKTPCRQRRGDHPTKHLVD
jgi:hypothetical protein